MDTKELQAGPELDVLIAEKVMGWHLSHPEEQRPEDGGRERGQCWVDGNGNTTDFQVQSRPPYDWDMKCFEPSTDIYSAWEVVEFLRKEGCDFDSFSSSTRLQAGWSDVVFMSQVDESFARAETLPLAICRAALLTVKKIR